MGVAPNAPYSAVLPFNNKTALDTRRILYSERTSRPRPLLAACATSGSSGARSIRRLIATYVVLETCSQDSFNRAGRFRYGPSDGGVGPALLLLLAARELAIPASHAAGDSRYRR